MCPTSESLSSFFISVVTLNYTFSKGSVIGRSRKYSCGVTMGVGSSPPSPRRRRSCPAIPSCPCDDRRELVGRLTSPKLFFVQVSRWYRRRRGEWCTQSTVCHHEELHATTLVARQRRGQRRQPYGPSSKLLRVADKGMSTTTLAGQDTALPPVADCVLRAHRGTSLTVDRHRWATVAVLVSWRERISSTRFSAGYA